MALHNLVYDCVTKETKMVPMTQEEETAQLDQWAAEDAKMAKAVAPLTAEDRIAKLEQIVSKLTNGVPNAIS